MAGKEFITAVEEKKEGGPQAIEFTLGREIVGDDGVVTVEKRDLIAHPPNDGQVALMMARMGRHSTTNDKVAAMIDFFVEVLDGPDHEYVVGRLMDLHDPFGIEDVTQVMTYLMEEWGKGRTAKSSASSGSRSTSGRA